jgi:3'(2'), 5'-bisphosphate nucleotidase
LGIKVGILTRDIAERAQLLDGLTEIASRAAAAILAIKDPRGTQRDKADSSPVTAADEASEAVILDGLAKLLPGVPVVSEESGQSAPGALGGEFLLVDPLDGTRELLAGEKEFAVNIAMVSGTTPALGVIAAPALGLIWRGNVGGGAERLNLPPGAPLKDLQTRTPIRTRPQPTHGAIALVSRFHRDAATDAFLDRFADVQRLVVGAALKFCRIAEGGADIYARMGAMSEWDLAAGHALVEAAGGSMTGPKGEPLRYGRPDFRIASFLARGDRTVIRA